jgi:hypothetical protein
MLAQAMPAPARSAAVVPATMSSRVLLRDKRFLLLGWYVGC